MTSPTESGTPQAGTPLVEKLRRLGDRASRGVSYGFEQSIWRESADALAALERRCAELQENLTNAIDREKRAAAQSKWALDGNAKLRAEIDRLKGALKQVGDDYPGSSCQRWCYQQAGLDLPDGALADKGEKP